MKFQSSQFFPVNINFLTFLLFFILQQSCNTVKKVNADNGYTVEGVIKGAAGKKIYLTDKAFYNETNIKDSVVSDSTGYFLFKGILKEPTFYMITVEDVNAPLDFILENSAITIYASIDSLWTGVVKGSKENFIREDFIPFTSFYANQEALNAIESSYDSSRKLGDTSAFTKSEHQKAHLSREFRSSLLRFINKYPTSVVAVNTIAYFIQDDLKQADSVLRNFEISDIGSHQQVAYFRKLIDSKKNLLPGKILPGFSQADTSGKAVNLSFFRNKYVLVDFWASWCKPCREENPNLLRIYEKYKSKGFTILSVSLDDKKENWLKAIQNDQLQNWTHVSDLKGWNNEVALLFGISLIPSNFLLDSSGKIIARDLRSENLERTMAAFIK